MYLHRETSSDATKDSQSPNMGQVTPAIRDQDAVAPNATTASESGVNGGRSATSTPANAPSLANSRDYFEFAQGIYDAARSGDHDAQYYLSRALKYCDDGYRFYFGRGKRRRTLDESLQWASTRPDTSVNEVKEVFQRCERLKVKDVPSPPFGTAAQWLAEATKGGVGLAQVDTARQLSLEAGASGAAKDVEKRTEAKRLAVEALRSKDPAVIWGIGDLATLFVGDAKKASEEQWVWRVLACQRGYECGPNAEWVQFQCRFDTNCQPYDSGMDVIRRVNSGHFDEIEQRARELGAKIDANKFEDIGS